VEVDWGYRLSDGLELLGRASSMFSSDLEQFVINNSQKVTGKSFVVIGGAGSIGSELVKELIFQKAGKVVIVDLSENNLVRLIRDIRSGNEQIETEIITHAVDMDSSEFVSLLDEHSPVDGLYNFAALKHVRAERDPYTLSRMIRVNVINAVKVGRLAEEREIPRYFSVSTDKSVQPASAMGASKALMELFLSSLDERKTTVTMSRFANVLFSDGSLLSGFINRMQKNEPLSVPSDITRYFITRRESGQLCLIASVLGEHAEIFCPKTSEDFKLISFVEMTKRFLKSYKLHPVFFGSERESKDALSKLNLRKEWPCYLFESDTSGEKPYEEFVGPNEEELRGRFSSISVIRIPHNKKHFDEFVDEFQFVANGNYIKRDFIDLLERYCPDFQHVETNRNLDGKM